MYHCHLEFYFAGPTCGIFEIIEGMTPLERFTHNFLRSEAPEAELAAQADIIFANLEGRSLFPGDGSQGLEPSSLDTVGAVRLLVERKPEGTGLILIASKEQMAVLTDLLPDVLDIWVLPMSEEEVRFRFFRWQQSCKMEKDFWETRHFFESTINNVPNLVWYKDKNGIHEKVNDSFCRTVNKTKQQVEGQGHAYIWDVESEDPACIESERIVMTKQETCISEETVATGDGIRLLTTYKSPLYDLDGSVMGTVGVAIDITQERAYEQEIVQKNQTLEALFMTMECGVLCHSVEGTKILSINRAALEILGYESQEELLEKGFHMVADSVLDEDKGKLRDAILTLQEEGDSISVEYRVKHPDGKILHIMGNVKLMNEGGERFYQRFLLDCTAQKKEERKKQQELERRQMELVQALSIDFNLVCSFDLNTGKGVLLRLFGEHYDQIRPYFSGEITLEECMELYIEEYVYEEEQEMLRQTFTRERLKRELGECKVYYMNYRAHVGTEVKYFQMKVVRTGEWKENCGIVLGFRNVDEEIRGQMELNGRLKDALMQANRASKAKSVFLSNMSHDIRTPMNAIVGFTALAITHIDRKEQVEEYLTKIMTSGNHLLSLINDVLDMSRIESGKMQIEEKLCRLPDILHGLRNILQSDIHAKQLELYIDAVDVVNEDIYCDKLRLNQVLLNLVGNSVKYTPAGGIITMRVIEKAGAEPGYANYAFSIKDTGIGMSEEFVAHIFEPFEREENSTINKIQGTGLGMAITKNIIDMMNGEIEVKSEQGVGTEFIVSLTFRIQDGKKEPRDIPELKNARALVVDDDFNTCDSVSYMLQQIGMRAEWTLSGKEAVLRTRQANMRGDNYCVYIIDWMLPDLNGVEVARRVRKEVGDDVPIIVLTAYDWSDIEQEAREAGVTAFCSKPLFFSELRSCLLSIVDTDSEEKRESDMRAVSFQGGRILLAEDNELNQEIAVAILGDAGFETEIAGNGKIAVEMLSQSQPGYYKLVLMDVQMPEMNGYEATREIRSLKDPELSSIPILAMTANAFEEDKRQALLSGMNGHIAKPIDVKKLFDTLGRMLA